MSVYRNTLESYLKTLDVEADSAIDVAGASNPVSKRVRSWRVNRYDVLDNELERQQIEIDYKHDMNLPIDELMATKSYDIVFCLEMFDYIWNPVQACINLRWFCRPDSRLIVTFPFVYPNHNPVAYDMMRFTKQGAVKLLRYSGFEIDAVIPRRIEDTGMYHEWLKGEGYKMRGAEEAGTLFDAGYIIEAHAKPV